MNKKSITPICDNQESERLIQELQIHEEELRIQNEELHRVQAELEVTKDKFADLFDYSPVGYITIDMSNVIEEANLTASEILNVNRKNLIGKLFNSYIFCDDRDLFYRLKHVVLEKQGRDLLDIRLIRPDSNFFYARLEIMPVRSDKGRDVSFRIVISDNTALKKAENEAAKAADELRDRIIKHNSQLRGLALELSQTEQNERKRIAGVIHDNLQQLLVGIKLNIQSLLASMTDDFLAESLKQVADLTDESIQVSKSLVLELSPPVLHAGGLVPAVKWLSSWMKEKFGLIIEVKADVEIRPDPEGLYIQLFEFIRELLLNVVKHAKTNHAYVFIGTEKEMAAITVFDKGAGIKSEKEPDRTESGYGLFSIRERLSLLGGEMSINSSPEKGTSVSILAPFSHISINKDAVPAVSFVAENPAEYGKAKQDNSVRVLIADDHKLVREGIVTILESVQDIQVVGEAFNGENAVEMAREVHPDLIIMDINMPGMNGIEATKIIKSEFPDIAIIGLSMLDEPDRLNEIMRAGAVDFVHKAAASRELITSIINYKKHFIVHEGNNIAH